MRGGDVGHDGEAVNDLMPYRVYKTCGNYIATSFNHANNRD